MGELGDEGPKASTAGTRGKLCLATVTPTGSPRRAGPASGGGPCDSGAMMFRRILVSWFLLMAALSGCGGDDDGGGGSADAAGGGGDGGQADASGPATVTVRSYDGPLPSNIALVAYEDGEGAWQVAEGGGGVYTFEVASGRYAVATVCDQTALDRGILIRTYRLLTSDTTELSIGCPWHQRTGAVSGSVTGLESGDTVFINLGTEIKSVSFADPTYEAMILPGRVDLVATRQNSSFDPLRMIIRRGVTLSDGPVSTFDLGAGGFVPVVHDLAITGAVEGETYSSSALFTSRGALGNLGDLGLTEWAGVPTAELEADDVHVVEADTDFDNYREVFAFTHETKNMSLALPPPGDDATVSVIDTAPYVRLGYQPARKADHRLYALKYHQVEGPPAVWTDYVTTSWLDAGLAAETPDLSGLDGWNSDWELEAGMTVSLTSISYGSDGSVATLMDGLALRDTPPGYWGAPVTGLDGLVYTTTWWEGDVLP